MIDYSAISCVLQAAILAALVVMLARKSPHAASVDRLTAVLVQAYNQGFMKMSAQLDALNAAAAQLTTAAGDLTTATAAAVTAIQNASTPEDLSGATAAVTAASTAVSDAVAQLNAAVTPPAA